MAEQAKMELLSRVSNSTPSSLALHSPLFTTPTSTPTPTLSLYVSTTRISSSLDSTYSYALLFHPSFKRYPSRHLIPPPPPSPSRSASFSAPTCRTTLLSYLVDHPRLFVLRISTCALSFISSFPLFPFSRMTARVPGRLTRRHG